MRKEKLSFSFNEDTETHIKRVEVLNMFGASLQDLSAPFHHHSFSTTGERNMACNPVPCRQECYVAKQV